MIYTIGEANKYDGMIKANSCPIKERGGFVWETQEDAGCHIAGMTSMKVYGVEADWDTDAEKPPFHNPVKAKRLTRHARIVALHDDRKLAVDVEPIIIVDGDIINRKIEIIIEKDYEGI